MGPQIVSKAVMLVWTNLGAAIRATAVPFGLMAALPYAFALMLGRDAGNAGALGLLGAILTGLLFAWGAVAWHRYVLLEEGPRPVAAPSFGSLVGYLWAGIRVGAMMLLLLVPIVLMMLVGAKGVEGLLQPERLWLLELLAFGVSVLIGYAGLRFSMVLPAAAIGRSMTLRESRIATSGSKDAVLVSALLIGVLQAVLQSTGSTLLEVGATGLVLSIIITWMSAMIGLSILTALYGVLVEGRPVD